jgi:hypothetical protein
MEGCEAAGGLSWWRLLVMEVIGVNGVRRGRSFTSITRITSITSIRKSGLGLSP